MSQGKTLPVPVINGMREDVSPHVAPPGTLVYASNTRFQTQGEAESRRGTTAIDVSNSFGVPYSSAINAQGPDFLTAVPGGFVFGAGGFGWRYDFAKGALHTAGSYSDAVPYGRLASMASESSGYALGNHNPWPTSIAIGQGYIALCWSSGNGQQNITGTNSSFRIQVFTESGTLVTTINNSDYQAAWVLYDPIALAFVVVAQQAASGTPTRIDSATIQLTATSAQLSAFVLCGTMPGTTACWAAAPWPGQGWVIVYQSAAGAATIQKMLGTAIGVTFIFATVLPSSPLSVYADAANVYVGFVDVAANSTARARVYDTALSPTSPTTTIYADVAGAVLSLTPPLFGPSINAGTAFCVVGRAISLAGSSVADTFLQASQLSATGTLTTNSGPVYNMFPVSAPFNNGMIWCRYRTPNPASFGNNYTRNVLLDFVSNRNASSHVFWRYRYPRTALTADPFTDLASGDYRAGIAFLHLCPPQRMSTGHWVAGLPRLVRSEQLTGSVAWGLVLSEWLEFATEARRVAKHMGSGECIIPGAVSFVGIGSGGSFNYSSAAAAEPSLSNPANGVDQGFYFEPSIDAGVQSVTGTGAITVGGSYYVRRVIEWIDGKGRRHRSRASRAQLVTMTAANNTITFTAGDDFAWLREGSVTVPSGVVAHYYRTTSAGSTFYRATPPQGAPLAGAGATFIDIINDGQLATREILYTDGGVIDNESAPSCRFVALSESRVWVAGLWDKRLARSSKIIVPGEPVQFADSPAFDVVIPDDITAIAVQDRAMVFFCLSSIFAVQALGPNDQAQGDWGNPTTLTRSTGCINELSVLETSIGTFFQSKRGIEVLPRGLGEPVFIGAAVDDELPDGILITSANVVELNASNTARFCVPNAGAAGGTKVLIYEMTTGAWSVDIYPANVTAVCDTDHGAILALQSLSTVYGFLQESANVIRDFSGTPAQAEIASVLTWADIRPTGIAGQARFADVVGAFDEIPALGEIDGGTIKLTATIDKAVDAGATFASDIINGLTYLKHIPAQMAGSGCSLRLDISRAGWRFFGWSVGFDDMGGTRRTASTEQA